MYMYVAVNSCSSSRLITCLKPEFQLYYKHMLLTILRPPLQCFHLNWSQQLITRNFKDDFHDTYIVLGKFWNKYSILYALFILHKIFSTSVNVWTFNFTNTKNLLLPGSMLQHRCHCSYQMSGTTYFWGSCKKLLHVD